MARVGKETQGSFWKRIEAVERRALLDSTAFEDDSPELKAARLERVARDPQYFCQTYLPHYFRSEPAVFHDEWLRSLVDTAQAVEPGAKSSVNSVAACPRGFAKSTVISFGGALYLLIVKRVPFFGLITSIVAQSEEIVEAIADELEDNALLRSDFGELLKSRTPSKWGASVVTTDGCRLQALGADQGYRGLKHRQHRPWLFIIDDPETDVEVRNDKRRDKRRRWLSGKVRLALEPGGGIFLCQNFIHPDCLSAHIVADVRKAQEAEELGEPTSEFRWRSWRIFVYAARDEDGHSTWPSRFTDEFLEELEEADPEIFALEMMQRAIAVGSQVFQRANLRFFEEEDLAEVTVSYRVLAIDPSKGKTQRSDFSAIIVLAVAENGLAYVELADLKRRTALQILDDWFRYELEYHPSVSIVETVAFQELLKDVYELMCEERGLYPIVKEYTDNAPKELRIERLARPVNTGVIRFKREQRELVSQLGDFPHHAHDDGPDGLEMAWSEVQFRTRRALKKGDGMFGGRRSGSRFGARLGFEDGKGTW